MERRSGEKPTSDIRPEEATHQGSSPVFTLAVSPHGQLHLVPAGPHEAAPTPSVARRLEKAFSQNAAQGLLYLGSAEVSTPLPPAWAFWRDFARSFVHRLCANPDLEALRERVQIAPPSEELEWLLAMLPPLLGAEYVNLEMLLERWGDLARTFQTEIAAFDGTVQDWLQRRHPTWNMVGRVCFHLAENKNNPDAPFAFLATYTGRLTQQAKVQHLPLNRALKEYSSAADRNNLLKLLLPVQKAAEQSAWLKARVDNGDIYYPLALTPTDAYHLLQDVPLFEASGVVMRLPDWWNPRRPSRPEVRVTVGSQAASGVGLGALLDFQVKLTLDGQELTLEEWQQLMASTGSLVPLKGRWIEVDRERLQEVLEHWRSVQRHAGSDGLTFLEGMRLLAGAPVEGHGSAIPAETSTGWSRVVAGPWMEQILADLRDPERLGAADPGEALHGDLGRVRKADVVMLLSNSGRSDEITRLMGPLKAIGACVIAITGDGKSPLAKHADVVLDMGPVVEACPLGLAPTCSSTAMLVLGDALAMTVSEARSLSKEDFARFHPGGKLGRQLMKVGEVMRQAEENPIVEDGATLREAVRVMTETPGRPGATHVVDGDGRLVGLLTDGDLRRYLLSHPRHPDLGVEVSKLMARNPKTVRAENLVEEALRVLAEYRVDQVPVVDGDMRPVGLLDVQDLLAVRRV